MATELKSNECNECNECKKNMTYQGGGSDTVYAMGVIGAWVYFIGRGETTEDKIKGFFKGLFWPAYLVYEVFKLLERE
jgi:hypothetical protein